jgi:hypothetical protein
MTRFLAAIPRLLGARPWIVFLLALLVYLVGLGGLGLLIPAVEPTATAQLIFGNLLNVAGALAASLAAAAGTTAVAVAETVVRENRVHHHKQHLFREQMRAHLDLPHPDGPS